MVRSYTHISRGLVCLAIITAALSLITTPLLNQASADSQNVSFEVDVRETLAVAVTTPGANDWASGNAGNFLRNTVTLAVSSNNAGGYTASMTTKSAVPNLENTAATSSSVINTISSSSAKSSFPAVGWGYSLEGVNNGDTVAGTNSGVYNPMVGINAATPIPVMSSNVKGSSSQNIFFGAKADYTVDSGVYMGTVVISVVTGTVNNNTNPAIPDNPATPNDPGGTNPYYSGSGTTTGGSTNGTTTYTTVSSAATTVTTTTHVDEGDTRASYTNPAGVTRVNEGTPLATGLAATSAVAAATGIIFFIVAKRRKDDEDEDEEEYYNT